MVFAAPLVRGRLVRRWKRFLSEIVLDTGETVRAHCPNPGAMLGLNATGLPVWVEPNDDPRRKLDWAWRLAELPEEHWAGIDTGVPNRVVAEALRAGTIPELAGYATHRAEVAYAAASRVDFLLSGPGRPDTYVEVKNVHLRRSGGLAEFPDCVTLRGARHLGDLSGMVALGHRAVMLYVVQRTDCTGFALADDLDPGYAAAAAAARAAGVESLCWDCAIAPAAVTLRRPLPI